MDTNSFLRMSFLFAAALAAASCASTKTLPSSSGRVRNRYESVETKYNEEWRGRSHSEIISAFGAPDREVSDGADGYILIYETVTQNVRVDEDLIQIGSSRSFSTSTTYNKSYVHFYIGADRFCYNVRTNKKAWTGKHDPWDTVRKVVTWSTVATAAGIIIGWICSEARPMPSPGF